MSGVLLKIGGTPVAQPRPRFDSRSRRTYTPDAAGKLETWKGAIASCWLSLSPAQRRQTKALCAAGEPIELSMLFVLERKKSSKLAAPTSKPDLDNLEKPVMDELTKLGVWKDDSQVVKTSSLKRWAGEGEKPGATVLLRPYPMEVA